MKKDLSPAIRTEGIIKNFFTGLQEINVLKGIDVEVERGTFCVLFGPSGCGKSTLLHTILGLEPPTKGVVKILDTDLYGLRDEDARSEFRKQHMGMIYQQPNWIKSLSVIENVAFPLKLLGESVDVAMKKASEMLDFMGMLPWADHVPSELSSGQQQRIAAGRAMVVNPEIIVADEPTGNLDYESGETLMKTLSDLSDKGKTIIMVTHDLDYLKYAKSGIRMFDGKVEETFSHVTKDKMLSHIRSKRR